MKPFLLALAGILLVQAARAESPLVLQSDFGTRDGAVAAMKGVAASVSTQLAIHDLTHEIPPYDIWEGAIRLVQAAAYWPEGTVFVSVVDPGVGTDRKSIVMRSRSGHFFVTPDNGTLTFVAQELGVDAVREIDEAINRRAGSEQSYTFHGRDVYAYTGARLAAGVISFDEVGRELPARIVSIPYQRPAFEDGVLKGNVPILDVQYGNVWTNIDRQTFGKLDVETGDRVGVTIRHDGRSVYEGRMPYQPTFDDVPVGEPLLYLNSLDDASLAINQGDFAKEHGIGSGPGWSIEIEEAAAVTGSAGPTLLVFSKTAAFRHDSIPAGVQMLRELGEEHGFGVEHSEDAAVFAEESLERYAAIVFLMTTGDILDAGQQQAFQRYIRNGGAYAGIHAAADTEHDWPWYAGLVGAWFESHPEIQDAVVDVEDREHPSTVTLPLRWERTDEWYNYDRNPRGAVHVLLTLDETSYDGGEHDGDHPIAWCHNYDGARSWYTGGGHTVESYAEPLFRQHVLGGIRWLLAMEDGSCDGGSSEGQQ